MYLLLEKREETCLRDYPEALVVHRYPSRVLIRMDPLPEELPRSGWEVLDDTVIAVHGRPVEIPGGNVDPGDEPHTLVRFIGPLALEWKLQLDRSQVEIRFWCPRFGACLRFPDALRSTAIGDRFPFIAGAQPYRAADCSRGLAPPGAPMRRLVGLPDGMVDIVCFGREHRLRVAAELERMQIPIAASSSSKLRVRFSGDPDVLRDLVGVKLADAARAPLLLGNSVLLQTLGAVTSEEQACPYTGRDQIVAVADSGLDAGKADDTVHPDFRERVRYIASWPINPSWSDYVVDPEADDGAADRNTGHGTHVAGLAVGSGARSDGKHRGVATEARLVFQAIEQYTEIQADHQKDLPSGYYLSGRPLDLRELFGQARTFGARIHINAWGDNARGQYTDDCYEADLFLHEHPDALILFAAGNEGADQDRDRTIDRYSLYAPASAKNVVAVGAVEGGVLGIGFRGNWGDLDENSRRFLDRDDRQDPISGEPDRIALFSSAGPSADGRIKPDVCAPGTNLAAPRSSATQARGWGLASPLPHYMYYGGTSMATGVAGGFAALLRQAWQENNSGTAPSGTALKALMILGARPVLRRKDDQPEPPHVSGFGRLNLAGCRPDATDASVVVYDEREPGLTTGEEKRYAVHMPFSGRFRAVLAWYDAPGETLVNDLDLCLTDPRGNRIWGNHGIDGRTGPDRTNTVEVIDLDDLAAGDYHLTVMAANIPEPPQPFALILRLPSARRCAIPVGYLKGIGRIFAGRLADHGISQIAQLIDRQAHLADLLDISPGRADLLGSRLQLLQTTTSGPRPSGIAPNTTLHYVLNPAPPAPVPPAARYTAKQALSPLRLVFDKSRLKHITLLDLFG